VPRSALLEHGAATFARILNALFRIQPEVGARIHKTPACIRLKAKAGIVWIPTASHGVVGPIEFICLLHKPSSSEAFPLPQFACRFCRILRADSMCHPAGPATSGCQKGCVRCSRSIKKLPLSVKGATAAARHTFHAAYRLMLPTARTFLHGPLTCLKTLAFIALGYTGHGSPLFSGAMLNARRLGNLRGRFCS